jgi:hypothetical protein
VTNELNDDGGGMRYRFSALRLLECDEDKERFEAKLKRIATGKSLPSKPSPSGPSKRRHNEKI